MSRFLPCAVATLVALAVPAAVVTPGLAAPAVTVKPRDQALYIAHKGIKSADFHSRGMAYRALAADKGNKDLKQILHDGMLDPQWVVRRGVAEALYAIGDPMWKRVVHDALVMPVLSAHEVLPILDDLPDAAAFAVLIDTLADKEHDQQARIVATVVARNRPNLANFLKTALSSKDPLVGAAALVGVGKLDPALQAATLDVVAKAHPANEALAKVLVEVASNDDERRPAAYLAPLKVKDPALAARLVQVRARHGDRTVGKALIAIVKATTGAEQLNALAAYRMIADKADAEALKPLLNGAGSELVFAVYELLARMGDRSMASEAQKLADSTDVDVRATGVFYLGWVGGAGRLGEMHQYLRDAIPSVRVAAVRVIGYIASPISVGPIRDALDYEKEERVRIELIKALAAIKHKDGYQALMFYTREKDTDIRRLVVRALADSGESLARPGLQNALNDNDARIRAEAVRGFILSDRAEAVKVWRRSIKKLPRGLMLELTRELDKTMEGFLEIALFEASADDNGTALREEALLALHLLPAAENLMLHKILDTTEDEDLRVRVLRQLVEIEGKKMAVAIKSLALSSGIRTRLAAIRLLGKLKGDKEATELMVRFLDEPDERVRIAASLTVLAG